MTVAERFPYGFYTVSGYFHQQIYSRWIYRMRHGYCDSTRSPDEPGAARAQLRQFSRYAIKCFLSDSAALRSRYAAVITSSVPISKEIGLLAKLYGPNSTVNAATNIAAITSDGYQTSPTTHEVRAATSCRLSHVVAGASESAHAAC